MVTKPERSRATALKALGRLILLTVSHNCSMTNMIYSLIEEVHRRRDQSYDLNLIIYAVIADLMMEMFGISIIDGE